MCWQTVPDTRSRKSLHVFCADVRDHASYPALVDWVGSNLEGQGLNVLVNNAGIAHFAGFEEVTREIMLEDIETNAIAPLMMTKVPMFVS